MLHRKSAGHRDQYTAMPQIDPRVLPDSLSFVSPPRGLLDAFLNLLRRVFLLVLLLPKRAGCLNYSSASPLWLNLEFRLVLFSFSIARSLSHRATMHPYSTWSGRSMFRTPHFYSTTPRIRVNTGVKVHCSRQPGV